MMERSDVKDGVVFYHSCLGKCRARIGSRRYCESEHGMFVMYIKSFHLKGLCLFLPDSSHTIRPNAFVSVISKPLRTPR